MHAESPISLPDSTQSQGVEPGHSIIRQPRVVLTGQLPFSIFAFPPNRDTLGGTAYFIVGKQHNILIDSPPWHETTQQFLQDQGGVDWFCLTHRNAMSHVGAIQKNYGCRVLVQEQEAYLLPGLAVQTFQAEFELDDRLTQAIWTPGYSPGATCLYHPAYGGVLFSGRHLLPNPQGELLPLRMAKTFHWPRQLQSVQRLVDRFSPGTLQHLCPGANTGFLRGQRTIDQAYEKLKQLDFQYLAQGKV